MAPFRVKLDRRAEREFAALPKSVRARLYRVFEALETDPYRPRPGCDIRVLQGNPSVRAVRVGDDRGIYEVLGDDVWFTKFGRRKNVYG